MFPPAFPAQILCVALDFQPKEDVWLGLMRYVCELFGLTDSRCVGHPEKNMFVVVVVVVVVVFFCEGIIGTKK